MAKLNRCPWCGDEQPKLNGSDGFWSVECSGCGARGPVESVSDDESEPGRTKRAKTAATDAWNKGPVGR